MNTTISFDWDAEYNTIRESFDFRLRDAGWALDHFSEKEKSDLVWVQVSRNFLVRKLSVSTHDKALSRSLLIEIAELDAKLEPIL